MGEDRRKILVTGAAGFIGSRLCEVLAAGGHRVVAIDNLNDYYDPALKRARLERLGISLSETGEAGEAVSRIYPDLRFLRLDIKDRDGLQRLFAEEKFSAVMNLAAQAGVRYSLVNPYSYVDNNVVGFLNLLECARNFPVEKFLYASSSSVYGGNVKTPFSESDNVDNPASLYAATKKSNELMARAYRNLFGIPAVGLRFFTVYGPWGRPDMAPMLFASAIAKGEPIKIFNNGDMSRDFTYIDDIVDGIVKILESEKPLPRDYDVYNIGHGSPVSLMDFISLLESKMGMVANKVFMPMQQGDVKSTFADTSLLERDFGYKPSTSLETGISRFVDWFKSHSSLFDI